MKERHTPQKIKNLRDLHSEQERVQEEYKQMEEDWIATFASVGTIAPIFLRALSSFGKGNARAEKVDKKHTSARKDRPHAAQPLAEQHRHRKRKSYKKLGKTLLIWQAVSFTAFIMGNIALHFRKKKQK